MRCTARRSHTETEAHTSARSFSNRLKEKEGTLGCSCVCAWLQQRYGGRGSGEEGEARTTPLSLSLSLSFAPSRGVAERAAMGTL